MRGSTAIVVVSRAPASMQGESRRSREGALLDFVQLHSERASIEWQPANELRLTME
jgi:hypothetical protein